MSQTPNEYNIVAFDPGGTIGWAHLTLSYYGFSRPEHKALNYLEHWDCGEFTGSEHEQLEEAKRLIHRARFGEMPYVSSTDVVSTGYSRTDIVSEDFELTQTIGGKNLLGPVRINAVLDWECSRIALKLNLQRRSMRTNVTPDRLLRMGFESPINRGGRWTTTSKGKDAFAAMQHAIVWLRRTKEASKSKPWMLSDKQTANAFWDCACERGRRCDLTHPRR
jgi:hypothetical protein